MLKIREKEKRSENKKNQILEYQMDKLKSKYVKLDNVKAKLIKKEKENEIRLKQLEDKSYFKE